MLFRSAFSGCTGELIVNCDLSGSSLFDNSCFSNIVVGDEVSSIGDRCFSNCVYAKNIIIGDGVKKIGQYAFNRCVELTSITIPKGVTNIEPNTFGGCESLVEVYCMPEVPAESTWSTNDKGVFPFNEGLKIYIPRNSYAAYVNYKSPSSYSAGLNWGAYKNYYIPYDFE